MLDKLILTNLKAGWCNFNLGDFKGRVSYIRDVPNDIINGYMEYIKTEHCVIEFDEEDSWFSLVICNEGDIYIIAHRDKLEFYSIDLNSHDVLDELFTEIEENLEDWVNWGIYSYDEKDIYRNELQNKINDINTERNQTNDEI